jgi:hypothetical protein
MKSNVQRATRKFAAAGALAAAFLLLGTLAALCPSRIGAQVGKAALGVEGDIPVFAIAPDNRVAYAVRHIKHVDKSDVERDDLWLITLGGKKERLLDSQKIIKGSKPVNCAIRQIRWASDSRHLIVGVITSAMADEDMASHATERAIAMDDNQRETPIETALATAFDGRNAAWLDDGATVVFQNGASEQASHFQGLATGISSVHPPNGKPTRLFDGKLFEGIAWDVFRNRAIAVERNLQASQGLQLVWLDLASQKERVVIGLANFEGQLTLSPSRKRVAYFSATETIEIRDLDAPAKAISMHVPPGHFEWVPGGQYLLLKRDDPAHATEIFWIHIPDGGMKAILQGLVFGSFQISPDGTYLGLQNAGQTGFQLLPMAAPGS